MYASEIISVLQSPEFQKLREIGGHRVYHLEGDALTHTMRVALFAAEEFGANSFEVLLALLHDVGKIYSSVYNGPNDWTYPGHAKAGAENLDKFLPVSHPDFSKVQWYIANHIKPLFWRGKNIGEEIAKLQVPEGCSIITLLDLVICDVLGSKSVEPQDELLRFLAEEVYSRKRAIDRASEFGLEYEVLQNLNAGDSPEVALREWDL